MCCGLFWDRGLFRRNCQGFKRMYNYTPKSTSKQMSSRHTNLSSNQDKCFSCFLCSIKWSNYNDGRDNNRRGLTNLSAVKITPLGGSIDTTSTTQSPSHERDGQMECSSENQTGNSNLQWIFLTFFWQSLFFCEFVFLLKMDAWVHDKSVRKTIVWEIESNL